MMLVTNYPKTTLKLIYVSVYDFSYHNLNKLTINTYDL